VLGHYSRFQDYGYALYREQGIPALSVEDQDAMYKWMGLLDDSDTVGNLVPIRYWTPGPNGFHEVVFLEQNRTGGGYNQDFPERDILEYLRFGGSAPGGRPRPRQLHPAEPLPHHWPLGCDYKSPPKPTATSSSPRATTAMSSTTGGAPCASTRD
jgi:hypothetical protein